MPQRTGESGKLYAIYTSQPRLFHCMDKQDRRLHGHQSRSGHNTDEENNPASTRRPLEFKLTFKNLITERLTLLIRVRKAHGSDLVQETSLTYRDIRGCLSITTKMTASFHTLCNSLITIYFDVT
jgi:hypothetical protein